MKTHKVEQLIIATVGFFWCFLMWFSTAAFSPSIAAHYHLSLKALGLLASSAIWMVPIGPIVAGWASDGFVKGTRLETGWPATTSLTGFTHVNLIQET